MGNLVSINTTKEIFPQIYAYTLPTVMEKKGWIKIGYTERKDVDQRIKEQTNTAAMKLTYEKLWSEPAKFAREGNYFKDHDFHAFLMKYKKVKRDSRSEWFYYNGHPEQSHLDFRDFTEHKLDQIDSENEYVLRVEQQRAVDRTMAYFLEHPNSEFLWNAKPRFGKTLTTYDLIRRMDAINVLIVTNRPAIANSWFDDFEKFIAWQTDYLFVSSSDSLKERPALSRKDYINLINEKSRQIAFFSLQDLKGAAAFGGVHDKHQWVKQTNWDILVIDESHEGIDTFKTDVAFNQIKRNYTLHLSGTPFKAVSSGKFAENQIFNWTYTDEQFAKENWDDANEINNPYEQLPKLNMFTYQMSLMITDEIERGAQLDGENIDYAFDLNEFFATNEQGKFIHEKDVLKWLDTLTHNEKYPFSTHELRKELKHTFWILERVASAKALANLLSTHHFFENYKIIIAAGDGRRNEDEDTRIKHSLDVVKDAIKNYEKTITLSVGQLTTGVTIPEWTAVLMLSNMKSASLYMQAAFRSQNPWVFEENGVLKQKRNAYVFDFSPERTLMIYDEFANNLAVSTANGRGSTKERKENLRQLLNFFPVIAEDYDGKLVELDVEKVLTIPKMIKAKEVVKRGFMSNFLFQNISGIFMSEKAKEIINNLHEVDERNYQTRSKKTLDLNNIQLDSNGEVEIDSEIVATKNNISFGPKVYSNMLDTITEITNNNVAPQLSEKQSNLGSIADQMARVFVESTKEGARELAKESGIAPKVAETIVREQSDKLKREIELVESNYAIEVNELKMEYDRKIQDGSVDKEIIDKFTSEYEEKVNEISNTMQQKLVETVKSKTIELTENTTLNLIKKSEEKKKNKVEDEVRSRLRGFTRTIPSFLMAYGTMSTTLESFDTTIKESVFKDVTGITLEQFKILRDEYHFFDPIVFNESVQEFMRKKEDLANYFDESQEEDIFDYIPPQKTNQIYTPKDIVKMMVDKLEEENPSIFLQSDKKFADLYMKSGLYITEIVTRLFKGLKKEIPDDTMRIKHILENQVYGFAPTEIIYNIARNYIFGFDDKAKLINDDHIVLLDTTPFARGEGDFELKCEELFGGDK
jgi:restriction endonuclease